MPRLFTAIELPADVAFRLSLLKGGLPGAHWLEPENYHVTLRFAGDIPDRAGDAFAEALAEIDEEGFALELEGVGSFGGDKPRSIWVGVQRSEPLVRLQKAHERAARQAGLAPETRNFVPHVTLARLRQASAFDVAAYLARQGGLRLPAFQVSRFVLLSSRAHHGGGPYSLEASYDLR